MEPDPLAYARGKVTGPAIALLVVNTFSLAVLVPSLAFSAWLLLSGTADRLPQPRTMSKETQITVRIVWNLLMEIVNLVILIGAVRMWGLRNYRLARAACTLALIPCLGPCFLLGIPFGVWGRTALNDPVVRSAFDNEPGTPEAPPYG